MNQGWFWTDPDRLARSGTGYTTLGEHFQEYAGNVGALAYQHAHACGDDEEGLEFAQALNSANQQIVDVISSDAAMLAYVGDGVEQNGRDFGDARDYADDSTFQYRNLNDQNCAQETPLVSRVAIQKPFATVAAGYQSDVDDESTGAAEPLLPAVSVSPEALASGGFAAEVPLAPVEVVASSGGGLSDVVPGEQGSPVVGVEPLLPVVSVSPEALASGGFGAEVPLAPVEVVASSGGGLSDVVPGEQGSPVVGVEPLLPVVSVSPEASAPGESGGEEIVALRPVESFRP